MNKEITEMKVLFLTKTYTYQFLISLYQHVIHVSKAFVIFMSKIIILERKRKIFHLDSK